MCHQCLRETFRPAKRILRVVSVTLIIPDLPRLRASSPSGIYALSLSRLSTLTYRASTLPHPSAVLKFMPISLMHAHSLIYGVIDAQID